jgi:hypothetical protein
MYEYLQKVVISKTNKNKTYFWLAYWKLLTKRAGSGSGAVSTKVSRNRNNAFLWKIWFHVIVNFVPRIGFLCLKTYVNVPTKRSKQNKLGKNLFLVRILKVTDEKSRIRIRKSCVWGPRRTKMSLIRNTGFSWKIWFLFIVNIVANRIFTHVADSFWPSLKGKSQNVILIEPVIMFILLFSDR